MEHTAKKNSYRKRINLTHRVKLQKGGAVQLKCVIYVHACYGLKGCERDLEW